VRRGGAARGHGDAGRPGRDAAPGGGLAALAFGLAALLAARGLSARAPCDTLSGRVRAGQSYEHPFGDGLRFRLRAEPSAPPNPAGWTIEVRPRSDGEHEYSWVATPPYRFWNPRYVDTSYGVSAREAVARSVRRFGFVTGEEAYDRLARAVELLTSSRPAGMTDAAYQAARDSAEATWKAMMEDVGRGELRITDAAVSDSTAERPGGRIERLAFTVALCPGGEEPGGGEPGG